MDLERRGTSGACQEPYRGEECWSDAQGTPERMLFCGAEGNTNRSKSRRSELRRRSGSPKALPRRRGGQARQEEEEKEVMGSTAQSTATPSSAKKLCSDV